MFSLNSENYVVKAYKIVASVMRNAGREPMERSKAATSYSLVDQAVFGFVCRSITNYYIRVL